MRNALFLLLLLPACLGKQESKPFFMSQGMSSAPQWGRDGLEAIFSQDPASAPALAPRIPQRADAATLFSSLPGLSGDSSQGFLVCKITVPTIERITGTNRADPVIEIESPEGELLRYDYDFNQELVYLTLPMVALRSGSSWVMKVYDQNHLRSDELMGRLHGDYHSGAMTMRPQGDSYKSLLAECRGADQSSAAEIFQRELAQATQLLDQLEGVKPEPPALQEVASRVVQLAALVGWQDSKVKALVSRVDALRAAP